jgi:DNA-binding response OmpR family regulator
MRADPRAARIIVVDDNKDTADLMAWWLRTGGFIVETAADGAAALALMDTFKAHCVLLDVLMPRVDGLELARQLRARHERVVLIAMSGLGADDSRVADTSDLVDHYFEKPVDLDALAKVLEPWPAE